MFFLYSGSFMSSMVFWLMIETQPWGGVWFHVQYILSLRTLSMIHLVLFSTSTDLISIVQQQNNVTFTTLTFKPFCCIS